MSGTILGSGRGIACLVALAIVSGFSASQAKASKAVSILPYAPSLERNTRTPSNGHNPNLVYLNVGKGFAFYDKHKKIWEMEFIITSSMAKHQAFTVKIATKNSSAKAGFDYQGEAGTITFKPLQTSYAVYVPIIPEPTPNYTPASFYLVTKSASGNVQLGNGEGVGKIPSPDFGGLP
jgi:hypothetical protein